jgi:hypothetical protein
MPSQRHRRRRAGAQHGDEATTREQYKRHLDSLLDEALRDTFPASDPIAVTPRRRKAPPAPEPRDR